MNNRYFKEYQSDVILNEVPALFSERSEESGLRDGVFLFFPTAASRFLSR